jgi:hypothetical protein
MRFKGNWPDTLLRRSGSFRTLRGLCKSLFSRFRHPERRRAGDRFGRGMSPSRSRRTRLLLPPMIQGGEGPRRQWPLRRLALDGNAALMPGISENAIKVLRLGSAHRNWKSAFSVRLAQDDGILKRSFCRGLLRDAPQAPEPSERPRERPHDLQARAL